MKTGTYPLSTGIIPEKREIEMPRPKGVHEYHEMTNGPVERLTGSGSDSAPAENGEIDSETRKEESPQSPFVND